MTHDDAKRVVIEDYERRGYVVFEQRIRYGLPAIGQIVVVSPESGHACLVRILTGKRPPRAKRLIHDKRREGICDLLAVVDPRDGSILFRQPASSADASTAA